MTPVVLAVKRVMPSVVNIATEEIVQVVDPFDSYFTEFFRAQPRVYKEAIPLGSGVIVDRAGLILTNYHVVRRASRVLVHLWNGKSYPAKVIAGDATNDLALLQLQKIAPEEKLEAIPFAVPDDLLLGEAVVAVGNPFGLEHSVSLGVLSAKNRSLEEGDRTFNDILQTDAAINPGNSGGPLINADGQLIGINLAIRRDAEGIGFAIPLRRIESVLSRWLVPARFSLATCGFVPGTHVDHGRMQAIVAEVEPDGVAAAAGLTEGERILKVNGMEVTRALDVGRLLWAHQVGDRVTLELEKRTLTLPLAKMASNSLLRQRLGVQLQELGRPLLKAMGLPLDLHGLAISELLDGSPLAEFGVRRGDILISIQDKETGSLQSVFETLSVAETGSTIAVGVVTVQNLNGQILLSPYRLQIVVR